MLHGDGLTLASHDRSSLTSTCFPAPAEFEQSSQSEDHSKSEQMLFRTSNLLCPGLQVMLPKLDLHGARGLHQETGFCWQTVAVG